MGARILWLDAFTANVDRSWRNPNLLRWHDEVWVIDHGAALYFHHGWSNGVTAPERFAAQAVGRQRPRAARSTSAGWRASTPRPATALGHDVFVEVLAEVPDAWLEPVPGAETPEQLRAAYVAFLDARLATRAWLPLERSPS